MSTFATDRTEELELRLRAIKINRVPSGAKKGDHQVSFFVLYTFFVSASGSFQKFCLELILDP